MHNTKNYLDLLSIERNILILKNSYYAKIIEVFPDNFILADIDERERFLRKYEEFILSAKFSIQITAINFKLKRKENLKYTNNMIDKKLKALYEDSLLNDSSDIFKNLYNQRFFLIYSIFKKRKHLDYIKDVKEVEDLFTSEEKQIKYMLSQIPLSFRKLTKRDINLVLNYFYL